MVFHANRENGISSEKKRCILVSVAYYGNADQAHRRRMFCELVGLASGLVLFSLE